MVTRGSSAWLITWVTMKNPKILFQFAVVSVGLTVATESFPQGTNNTTARKNQDTNANIPATTQAADPALANWSSLIPSIIGGLIAGTFAIVATWFTYRHNLTLNQIQQQRKINGFLMAIRNEVEIAHDIYRRKAGNVIEKVADGKPCLTYFSVTEKYFIVYPNNTEIVGQVNDPDLCKAIIDVYNTANYVMDGLRVNNWYLDKRSEYGRQNLNHTDGGVRLNIKTVEEHLVSYAPGLKQGNTVLNQKVDNLFAKIDDYLQHHLINI